MCRRVLFLICVFFQFNAILYSANVSLSASAPRKVGLDDEFNLVYSVVNGENDEVEVPSLEKYFDIIAGPIKSSSKQVNIVNGKIKTTSSVSVTYILKAKQVGNIKIPEAKVKNGSEYVYSNKVEIQVVKGSVGESDNRRTSSRRIPDPFDVFADPFFQEEQQRQTAHFTASDAFLRTDLSKTSVYEQENVCATINLYAKEVSVENGSIMPPKITGFMTESIQTDPQKEGWETEINGQKYKVYPLLRYLITPIKSGKASIGEASFNAILRYPNGAALQHQFRSDGVQMNILPLPKSPQNYQGAIGNFEVSIANSNPGAKIYTNGSFVIRFRVHGNGNLKNFEEPHLKLPDSFESFPVKTQNNIKYTDRGIEGDKYFDFTIVPHKSGTFIIPETEVICFNPTTKKYETLKTNSLRLEVEAGASSPSITQNKSADLPENSDIDYIRTDTLDRDSSTNPWVGSYAYWLIFAVPLILFVIAYIGVKENFYANFKKKRHRESAYSLAAHHVEMARNAMHDNASEKFYDEVENTFDEYFSTKYGLSISELSRDELAKALSDVGIREEIASDILRILDICQMSKYSKENPDEPMGNVLSACEQILGQLKENK